MKRRAAEARPGGGRDRAAGRNSGVRPGGRGAVRTSWCRGGFRALSRLP